MKFLSFSQPWLWAILDPIARKHVENRVWQPPIAMIGQRFALHAAKSWDADAMAMFIRFGIDAPNRYDSYDKSAIVGVATIDRIVTTDKTLPPDQARWFFGPFGWILSDVRKLATPIPMKGAQGLRGLAPEIVLQINAQFEVSS